ncbi:MAG: hypothetical protein DWQ37_18585 [Planctomycetota bacterium]|nr:MAG: hypothetical protein DWQ37_18585 [Planctomycetota bacterium]
MLSAVVGRHVFYNQSKFDGGDAAINASDDAAIAPDKGAYLGDVEFVIERLTDNDTYDTNPRVDGDKIVWEGRGGTDGGTDEEIFYYDGTTVTQLTENSDLDREAEVSDLGIVWERGNSSAREIIFYDGSETPLTSNAVSDDNSSLSDERLSWEQGDGAAVEVWTWDGVNPPSNLSNLPAVIDLQPYAEGNNTVWVSGSVPNRQVRFFNGTSTSIIGTSTFSIEDPRSDGDHVVWEGFKQSGNNQREIYYYNGSTVQLVTNDNVFDFDPQVEGNTVVWWSLNLGVSQVKMWRDGVTTQLSAGTRNRNPQISNGNVVWYGFDGNDEEIFLWNGYKTIQITDNDYDDMRPQISGNHIVWVGGSSTNGSVDEIYHTYITNSAASFDNITSYSRGINGIAVDIDAPTVPPTLADFGFKVGDNNAPATWTDAPAPSAFLVRPGAGIDGSDRVEIVWANGAIQNTWLEVTVKGNDQPGGFNTNTGLTYSDKFLFGNRTGDTGSGTPTLAITSAQDEIAARNNAGINATITNLVDFDRSGIVNAVDSIIARNNGGLLTKISFGNPLPPPAPSPASASNTGDDSDVAFALVTEHESDTRAAARVDERVSALVERGLVSRHLERLARATAAQPTAEDTPAATLEPNEEKLVDLLDDWELELP